MDDNLA